MVLSTGTVSRPICPNEAGAAGHPCEQHSMPCSSSHHPAGCCCQPALYAVTGSQSFSLEQFSRAKLVVRICAVRRANFASLRAVGWQHAPPPSDGKDGNLSLLLRCHRLLI